MQFVRSTYYTLRAIQCSAVSHWLNRRRRLQWAPARERGEDTGAAIFKHIFEHFFAFEISLTFKIFFAFEISLTFKNFFAFETFMRERGEIVEDTGAAIFKQFFCLWNFFENFFVFETEGIGAAVFKQITFLELFCLWNLYQKEGGGYWT